MTGYHAGLAAEGIAARHYAALGLSVLAHRWRGKSGEIDLILRDGAGLVFVEVKHSTSFAWAASRLSPRQTRRICAAASEFLATRPRGQLTECRFDVALVDGQGRVEVIENALMA
ncbi:putative endonuclease [Rhodovulum imhoffii]|uniref:UPF0102 protein C8N32_12418 n=1 Tax=Rhodovulum imhoffii TaxID=365340 RepID=A0A2T5BNY8_9RHOB|nr:YraN family protein [Rhodovulum imhoffii]MBK5933640.1 hypothetical protein [Rhodovulum imhoffii]PTN00724.1 putative endonuclease [Rhodovulum imhoffii]